VPRDREGEFVAVNEMISTALIIPALWLTPAHRSELDGFQGDSF
jgi:hypothetical protein